MNIEFLNLLKPPKERYKGRNKKNRGEEPIWAIIYIHEYILYICICVCVYIYT
jgi:hypothetical protein